MKIDRLIVEIKPWEILNQTTQDFQYELRIVIIHNNKRTKTVKTDILFEDDLISRFDLYFDYAKREIKELIKKEIENG